MTKDIRCNDPEDDHELKAKQEFRFTLAFGFGFITLMFLAFACGYLLGKKVFNLSETGSLILSLVVGMSTIILETILFVIRMEKMDAQSRKKERVKVE
jgi:membrane protein DedA with SNARE-associated domain